MRCLRFKLLTGPDTSENAENDNLGYLRCMEDKTSRRNCTGRIMSMADRSSNCPESIRSPHAGGHVQAPIDISLSHGLAQDSKGLHVACLDLGWDRC
jgi:hypothetical protein